MKPPSILVVLAGALAGCTTILGMDELPLAQPGADAGADATLDASNADGGVDMGGDDGADGGQRFFKVGGNVTGLQGTGLVLQNSGGDDLSVTQTGAFRFATAVASGRAYAVTVKAQPGNPAQTCTVTMGSGTVTNADVTSVGVTCTANCGNGTVDSPEQCDDGATAVGDGCSATCTIEPGWECTGTRSVCNRSCAGGGDGLSNCGPGSNESCCTSPRVTGVTTPSFSRSCDGVTPEYTDPQYKAQVSDFRLDKYEITVGRFRKFVDAVVAGWRPPAGSGKHTHLNGGSGLAASGGGSEPGWDAPWNTNLPSVKTDWDSSSWLACNSTFQTWTGGNERRPINCVNWYQAYAFCIWDGGFLPSEAEWNYAAAGGTEHRKYPWGSTEPEANANLAVYGCLFNGTVIGACTGVANIAPVGSASAGNGKWLQSDLAGNVWEWVQDWYADPYSETHCVNCSKTAQTTGSMRVYRGGDYAVSPHSDVAGHRGFGGPLARASILGARCARTF